jgi:hypothetical protein
MCATAIEGRLSPGARVFKSLIHAVEIGSEAYLDPYPMGTGAISNEVKRLEHAAGFSPQSSVQVTNEWSHTTILYIFS